MHCEATRPGTKSGSPSVSSAPRRSGTPCTLSPRAAEDRKQETRSVTAQSGDSARDVPGARGDAILRERVVSGGGGRVLGATHAGPPPTAKPPTAFAAGANRNSEVVRARRGTSGWALHASVGGLPDPGSKPPPTSEARSPARLLLTALQVAHGPKEESGFGTGLSGVPRPDEDGTRWWPSACVSLGGRIPLVWPRDPRGVRGSSAATHSHQDRVGATGAGQLTSVSCSSRPPANAQNTSPPVSHPGAPRLATGQVAEPRKQATRRRRKRTRRREQKRKAQRG